MSKTSDQARVQGVAELAAIVAESNILTRRLLTVLSDERTALGAGDVEGIDRCGQNKTDLTAKLDHLNGERAGLCCALDIRDDALDDCFAQCAVEHTAGPGWRHFLQSLELCREANAINGRVTNLRKRHVERALQILRGTQGDEPGLYGPDGRDTATGVTVLGQA